MAAEAPSQSLSEPLIEYEALSWRDIVPIKLQELHQKELLGETINSGDASHGPSSNVTAAVQSPFCVIKAAVASVCSDLGQIPAAEKHTHLRTVVVVCTAAGLFGSERLYLATQCLATFEHFLEAEGGGYQLIIELLQGLGSGLLEEAAGGSEEVMRTLWRAFKRFRRVDRPLDIKVEALRLILRALVPVQGGVHSPLEDLVDQYKTAVETPVLKWRSLHLPSMQVDGRDEQGLGNELLSLLKVKALDRLESCEVHTGPFPLKFLSALVEAIDKVPSDLAALLDKLDDRSARTMLACRAKARLSDLIVGCAGRGFVDFPFEEKPAVMPYDDLVGAIAGNCKLMAGALLEVSPAYGERNMGVIDLRLMSADLRYWSDCWGNVKPRPIKKGTGNTSIEKVCAKSRQEAQEEHEKRLQAADQDPDDSGMLIDKPSTAAQSERSARPVRQGRGQRKTTPMPVVASTRPKRGRQPVVGAAEASVAGAEEANDVESQTADLSTCGICQVQYDGVRNMVGCDGAGCPFEWYHLDCLRLDDAPDGDWLCSHCKSRSKGKCESVDPDDMDYEVQQTPEPDQEPVMDEDAEE